MSTHFFNGKLVSESEISISPREVGFSRGYAVFDFLRTYDHHRPFKLKEHVDRLFNSANLIGLQIPWSKQDVINWTLRTLEANNTPEEKFIKITISGGISQSMVPSDTPTIIIMIDPISPYPSEMYEKGVGVLSVKHQRYNPEAKSNNYIEGVRRTQEAKLIGAVEPLYYSDDQVFEGSNSNVFAVINNQLITPKTNILQGITRSTVLEILELDIPIKVEDFTFNTLLTAQEVFYTQSGKEITPITSIDGKAVGDGSVGPITKEVMRQFTAYIQSNKWQ